MKLNKTLGSIALLLVSFVASLFLGEGIARWVVYSDVSDADALYDRYKLLTQYGDNDPEFVYFCQMANPYLGWVNFVYPGCYQYTANNIGMADDRSFPDKKDSEYFSVFLLGGSVAEQMAETFGQPEKMSFLERALNRSYISPNGKPFRIYTGGIGGGAYPQQITLSTLYGDRVDAIIAIDGYNEALGSGGGYSPAGRIAPSYLKALIGTVYYLEHNEPAKDAVSYQKKMYRIFRKNKLTSRSYLAFLIYEKLFLKSALLSLEYDWSRETAFALRGVENYPKGLKLEERISRNVNKYADFIKSLWFISKSRGQYFAHFLQPIRWLYKPLTEKEKSYPKYVNVDFYKLFENRVISMNKKGVPTFSLLKILKGRTEEFYGDHIHFIRSGNANSPGNEIMAAKMAQILGKLWKLKRK